MSKVPVYEVTLSINNKDFTFLSLDAPRQSNGYGGYDELEPVGWIEMDNEEPIDE